MKEHNSTMAFILLLLFIVVVALVTSCCNSSETIETKEIFLSTDEKSNCIETLQRMTTRHPLFYKLKIIERPL